MHSINGAVTTQSGAAKIKKGDQVQQFIERRILQPIERRIPATAPLVAAVRKCGGCKSAVHHLNHDNTSSGI